MTLRNIVPALVAGSVLALPLAAQAATRHQHHMVRPPSRFFHRAMPVTPPQAAMPAMQMGAPGYGDFPNIRYFTRSGHVYFRNLDTGEVYLAKW